MLKKNIKVFSPCTILGVALLLQSDQFWYFISPPPLKKARGKSERKKINQWITALSKDVQALLNAKCASTTNRAGIINFNINISWFCILQWWINYFCVRSDTLQAFCRALNLENWILNKHVMGTFPSVWPEFVHFVLIHKSPCKIFNNFPIFKVLNSSESEERGPSGRQMTLINCYNIIVNTNIRKL